MDDSTVLLTVLDPPILQLIAPSRLRFIGFLGIRGLLGSLGIRETFLWIFAILGILDVLRILETFGSFEVTGSLLGVLGTDCGL